jgi:hypothetical protein
MSLGMIGDMDERPANARRQLLPSNSAKSVEISCCQDPYSACSIAEGSLNLSQQFRQGFLAGLLCPEGPKLNLR